MRMSLFQQHKRCERKQPPATHINTQCISRLMYPNHFPSHTSALKMLEISVQMNISKLIHSASSYTHCVNSKAWHITALTSYYAHMPSPTPPPLLCRPYSFFPHIFHTQTQHMIYGKNTYFKSKTGIYSTSSTPIRTCQCLRKKEANLCVCHDEENFWYIHALQHPKRHQRAKVRMMMGEGEIWKAFNKMCYDWQ